MCEKYEAKIFRFQLTLLSSAKVKTTEKDTTKQANAQKIQIPYSQHKIS